MTTETQVAYHGRRALKVEVMAKIAAHRAADRIAKGAYVRKNGMTTYCAVGCLLEDPEGGHMQYESYRMSWRFLGPERFMGAIEPGAVLSTVWPSFAVWLMTDRDARDAFVVASADKLVDLLEAAS